MNISLVRVIILLLLPVVYKTVYLFAANSSSSINVEEVLFHHITVGYYYILEFVLVGGIYVITNNCILYKGVMTVCFWAVIVVFVIAGIIHCMYAYDEWSGFRVNWPHMLVATIMLIITLSVVFYINTKDTKTETFPPEGTTIKYVLNE